MKDDSILADSGPGLQPGADPRGGSDNSQAPGAGLSGRNLYFQQIRSEITLSESSKFKALPDYQNAKFSNKRNGLVAGYGANTN